jgi:hypothetical protein
MREVKREAKERQKARDSYVKNQRRAGSGARGWKPYVACVVVVAVAAAGAVWWVNRPSATGIDTAAAHPTSSTSPGPGASPGASSGASPAASPSASPVVDPFDGTRAKSWPKGEKGLIAPKAKTVGIYRKEQVALAYAATTRYLKAAMLNPSVLYAGALDPVYDTLDPDVRSSTIAWAAKETRRPFFATRFWPAGLAPAGPTIRVRGHMTPGIGKDGVLEISFTYVAAYPVKDLKHPKRDAELVIVRREGALDFRGAGPHAVDGPYLGLNTYVSDHAVCGSKWGHPAFVEVYLAGQAPKTSSDPGPLATWDVSDPDQKPPKGKCYQNTGAL